MGGRRALRASVCLWGALALAGCAGSVGSGSENERSAGTTDNVAAIGLMTSLPIYWNGAGSVAETLNDQRPAHWARTTLETGHRLIPLDALSDGSGEPSTQLEGLRMLVIAQPRALTAQDNVALDAWVRTGGRLLLVIDPMLTEHFDYAIGDPRRPADVGLVPPVFARWGLGMTFDDNAGAGVETREATGLAIPVEQPGTLVPLESNMADPTARCTIEGGGIAARCRIGTGTALIVADAAFLDRHGAKAGAPLLSGLLDRLGP